jgi:hypothetical protein
VDFDHPSALCKRLANGELDIALVSSFEFLRNPIYRIVDNVSISSVGPVYSVVVAHSGDISGIDEVELDPARETSGNLLRCLLAKLNLARASFVHRYLRLLPGAPACSSAIRRFASTNTSDGISLLGPRRTMEQACGSSVRVCPLAGSA